MAWPKSPGGDWPGDSPEEHCTAAARSALEDALWEELLSDNHRSLTHSTPRETPENLRSGLLTGGIWSNNKRYNGRSLSRPNIVIRYIENDNSGKRKEAVPDSGFLRNNKAPSTNHNNYKVNSKYGRLCRRSLSLFRNSSMNRDENCPGEDGPVRACDESAPSVKPKLVSKKKTGFLDEPAYVREALSRDPYIPPQETDGKDSQGTSTIITAKIDPDLEGNCLVDDDELDSVDEELWLSANSFANVTSWMIKNKEHLKSAVQIVSDPATGHFQSALHNVSKPYTEDLQSVLHNASDKYIGAERRPHQVQIDPHQVQIDPHQVQIDPHQVQIDPHRVQIDPHQVQIDPHQVQIDPPHQVQIDPHQIQIDPHQVQIDPHQVQIDPHQFQIDPHQVQIDPHQVQIDTHQVENDPHQVENDPHQVKTDPRGILNLPTSFPNGLPNHDKDLEENTQGMLTFPKFSSNPDSDFLAISLPREKQGLEEPGRIVRRAVRTSFNRMRMEFRQRNGSTRSAPPCRQDPQTSPQDSPTDSERDSVKCYMEIVGCDISSHYQSNQTNNTQTSSMTSQGLQVGFGSSCPLQSLSELSIIENMTDLLKDIEKADLVLADHLGWLYHHQSGLDRWCVIADIIMCVFENRESNKPVLSILLPGADIYSPANKGSSNRNLNAEFRIVIDSNIAGQEHTFFARNEEDHRKWLNALQIASSFDQEYPNGSDGSDKTSPSANCFGSEEHYSFNPLLTSETGIELEMSLGSPDSMDSPVLFSKNTHFHLDLQNSCSDLSLQSESSSTSKESGISMLDSCDFKKLLRRDCFENGQSSPVKSLPSQIVSFSPSKSFSLDRRHFRSMESIDHVVLRKTNSNPQSNNSTTETSNSRTKSERPTVLNNKRQSSKKGFSNRRPLSQSLDLSKITPITSGLVRKASGFRERMFGKRVKSSLPDVTLGSLEDVKMSGFLQHKVLLKWQKLFFVVSRGYLYAFKTKSECETPEFVAILANYTITYLLSGREKKHKSTKPYVFKLSQPNSKSIYLCAAHSLDLARWIQVMQMEANKVSVDNEESTHDSFDSESRITPGLFPKTNARYALGSPADELEPYEFLNSSLEADKLSSTRLSDGLEVVSTERGRITVAHHTSDVIDHEIITAWDTSSSCSTIYSSTLESSSNASLDNAPRHDSSVTSVWQNDKQYRVNAIKKHAQKLKKNLSDRRKKWLSEGDLIIDTQPADKCPNQAEGLTVDSVESCEQKPTINTDKSEESSLSPPVPRRHKPVSVKHLPIKQLGNLDHCGYLERRHQDGAWVRYWFCLKSGWLYSYLTPSDFVTVDVINLDKFSVSCHHDRFQAKRFVLELSHQRYFPLFLAADCESTMAEWSLNISEGISTTERSDPPSCTVTSPEHIVTTVLSDDSSVPDDSLETATDTNTSAESNSAYTNNRSSLSEARQNLLEQVLKLKTDLEKKQHETKQKRPGYLHVSQSEPHCLDKKEQEEQLVQEITSLRQRRLSTQLKVDTLQRHMDLKSLNTSRRKPLFRFGGKQKSPTAELSNNNINNLFVEEQVKELTDRLQVIDQDLTYHEKNRQTLRPSWLDLANNNPSPEPQRRHGLFSGKNQKENRKRTQSLKLRTSVLSVTGDEETDESIHGNKTPSTEPSQDSLSIAKLNKGRGWFWKKRNGKESPQPEISSEVIDSHLNTEPVEACPPSPRAAPRTLPRREIDPQVLADIEEFEKMSRLALEKAQSASGNS